MYSDLFFNQIHLMVKACSTVGSFSAHFDTKGRFFYSTEKSRRKFHITIVIMSGYVAFLWIQTYKVWVYHGGEKNLHFHTAYGFSGILFMCVGILVSLLQNHDNVINGTNHILNYFPYFRKSWIPYSKTIQKYSRLLDIMVFVEVSGTLICPISSTIFFVYSPDNPIHPRYGIPNVYGLQDNLVMIGISLIFVTWSACVCWYALMLFIVFGTTYLICKSVHVTNLLWRHFNVRHFGYNLSPNCSNNSFEVLSCL
ncbi:hypothetical protein Fcan01_10424 [Folsomia candida]|uniref:Uncharacterized protein n=1 Tax=Folsomia candida TaxID=158441 RepID=A0A226E7Z9_FOLCA|nr:hypothetical protein Fcan01_10424 [Folsomia candida]